MPPAPPAPPAPAPAIDPVRVLEGHVLCYVVSEQLPQRQARMQASLAVEKLGARLVEGAGARTRSAKVPAQGLVEASAPEAAKRAAFAAATVVIVGDNATRPSGCGDDVTVAKFEWMVNLLKLKKPLPPDDYLVGAARAAPAPAPAPARRLEPIPRRSSAPSPCRWCATTAARCTRRTTTTSRGACVARRRS